MSMDPSLSETNGEDAAPLDLTLRTPRSPSRIPVETIQHIFSFHALRYELWRSEDRPLPTCTVFSIAQVCRRRRQIALDFPHLGDRILLDNLSVTTELLARSRNAPIAVHAAFSHTNYHSKLESVMLVPKDPRRIQEFMIHGSDVPGILVPVVHHLSTPLLTVLHYGSACCNKPSWCRKDTPVHRSPYAMGHAWFGSLSNLTSLKLSGRRGLSLDIVLKVLSTSPRLTHLHLVQVSDLRNISVPEHLKAELLRLQEFAMNSSVTQFAALLAHVQMPVYVKWQVALTVKRHERIVDLAMPPLRQRFVRPGAQGYDPRCTVWRCLCHGIDISSKNHISCLHRRDDRSGLPIGLGRACTLNRYQA
ncbi:hypothetical protein BV25DRAFT_286398 [Artomyces pyxidatus]|uniref:Uncharacterized protein n=1 Tax=Artomyces pyxidatus TaxID=48021 RepID=A0ACB8SF24_9AGAM|nr:hypothetical protein BV25DRAFT_286398 [Artomyces pyxidatus]